MRNSISLYGSQGGRSCSYAFYLETNDGMGMTMPRRARIDAPGALHHVVCRRIERVVIFEDNADRDDFVNRLGIRQSSVSRAVGRRSGPDLHI